MTVELTPAPVAVARGVGTRARLVRRAKLLSWLSLGWMTLEGAVAITAGIVAGSVALVGFGFATALWLALLLLAVAGAADFVSAVLRSTIVLVATPDALRGRITGIEFTQVAAAPTLGNVEAGVLASLTSLRFSIVSGGLACIAGCGLLALAIPALLRYDAKAASP